MTAPVAACINATVCAGTAAAMYLAALVASLVAVPATPLAATTCLALAACCWYPLPAWEWVWTM